MISHADEQAGKFPSKSEMQSSVCGWVDVEWHGKWVLQGHLNQYFSTLKG